MILHILYETRNHKITCLLFWRNAYPSVLGFNNFPKSISTSVNNVACHGLPDDRPLENGDIISIDVTVYKNGFHGVCGSTYVIGNVKNNPIVRYLRSVAEECLYKGKDNK